MRTDHQGLAPRALALAATLMACAGAGCGGTDATARKCNATAECEDGFVCAAGYCILENRDCNATTPCPGDLSCCGGVCKEGGCCLADVECNGGYCFEGACVDGSRGGCQLDADCGGSGQCLTTIRQCVECIASADCNAGYSCSPSHACVVETGCSTGSCAAIGKVCAPEQGQCRNCVDDAECGRKICENGTCVDCVASNQCGDGRVCMDGSCSRGQGTPCNSDGDCGGLVCVTTGTDKTCEPCFDDFECPVGATCIDNRCYATDGECQGDAQCDVPNEVCNYDACVPGCGSTGCPTGDICNPNTGRCVPFTDGTKDLGTACDSHADCLSNVCWPIDVSATTAVRRCGQTCTSTDDCPSGFVCHELGDGGTCLPVDFYPGGGPRDVAPNGTCTDTFVSEQCVSGYCNDSANTCYETCGNDNDCNASGAANVCVMRRQVNVDKDGDGVVQLDEVAFTALCQPPLPAGLAAGAVCSNAGAVPQQRDHDKCDSGYCAQTPDSTKSARCAGGCCTPSDCSPAAPICKPLDVWDGLRQGVSEPYGFQKVCLYREWSGSKQLGAVCNANSECLSEICAQGASGVKRCTQTCCTNLDCAGLGWTTGCRPPFFDALTSTGEEPVADAQFEQLVYALGRQIVGNGSTGSSFGVTPICFPE